MIRPILLSYPGAFGEGDGRAIGYSLLKLWRAGINLYNGLVPLDIYGCYRNGNFFAHVKNRMDIFLIDILEMISVLLLKWYNFLQIFVYKIQEGYFYRVFHECKQKVQGFQQNLRKTIHIFFSIWTTFTKLQLL